MAATSDRYSFSDLLKIKFNMIIIIINIFIIINNNHRTTQREISLLTILHQNYCIVTHEPVVGVRRYLYMYMHMCAYIYIYIIICF